MSTPTKNKVAPTPQVAPVNKPEAPVKYVVVRGGHRVSDKEYDAPTSEKCLEEISFWSGIAKRQSTGEKVEAVVYDSKRHRVW